MLNKIYKVLLSLSASSLAFAATTILYSTSSVHFGEPDCPSELLK